MKCTSEKTCQKYSRKLQQKHQEHGEVAQQMARQGPLVVAAREAAVEEYPGGEISELSTYI